jgi:transposase
MSMSKKAPTLRQFLDQFPTEEACLDHLMRIRYGDRHDCVKCGRNAHFYRVKARKVYSCEYCGAQVAPMAGTPFERTRTSLRDWFHVMFLFTTTRNGVAAKEVERQLGVTYKTAWRMCHEIRKYMAAVDGDEPIGGFLKTVEIDETWIGGKVSGKGSAYTRNKTTVLGMLERDGDIVTKVVPNRRRSSLLAPIVKHVKPYTEVHTDEFTTYDSLGELNGYWHKTVNHSAGQYATATGVTVNALEGFWAQLKRGISGTHIHVSARHLQKYLGEFQFRHNRRDRPETMLAELMLSFSR